MKRKVTIIPLLLLGLLIAGCQSNNTSSSSSSKPTSSSSTSTSTTKPSTSSSSSTAPTTPSSSSSHTICEDDNDGKVHIVILAGQSGARGKAVNTDLTDEQNVENFDVDIIADGLMMPALNNIPEGISNNVKIQTLKPGFGDTAAEFGPELGIGETLASRYPKDGANMRSLIIKYTASGSTFTNHWYSPSALKDDAVAPSLADDQRRTLDGDGVAPLTYNLYKLIDAAKEQIVNEGYEPVFDGATFIHGEQDAKFDTNMDIYEKCLSYFITDLRSYVEKEDMPVVVTEALTNSAKYSNKLREIQKRVSAETANVSFLDNSGLYTNTFEPWHFGAESNFELGNRIAAELVSLSGDRREVGEITQEPIRVSAKSTSKLPEYLDATFTNNYSGKVKVTYEGSYDPNKLGEQEVKCYTTDACGNKYTHYLKVIVSNEPFVDGKLDEYEGVKANSLGDLGQVYVVKGEEGLYVAAKINDKDLWTDGESWKEGDMGQKGLNDDFRIFLNTGDSESMYSILLSAANLLRIYGAGVSLDSNGLAKENYVYNKYVEGYQYRVTTKGIVNAEGQELSEGLELEFYIPYYTLNIENSDSINLMFDYNNVTSANGKKSNTNTYLTSDGITNEEYSEIVDANYISINDLI